MKLANVLKKYALVGLIPLCTMQTAVATEEQLDNTAAVVNDNIILESSLNDQTAQLLSRYKSHGANVDEVTARKQALQTLITRSLILQLAANNGFEMTDMQLDSSLDQMALRNNTSTENVLKRYGSDKGQAYAREKFKEEYIINEVRRSSVRQRVRISDSEITTLANALKERGGVEPMYHIAQVIIPFSSHPSDNEYFRIQNVARSAVTKIRNGANIEEIAAKYATNEQSADLGYVQETAIPLPFLPAIVNAHPGDVVGPFRSNIGMHVIKVIDVTTNAISPIKTYDASHILIKTSIIFSDEAARAKILSIADQIKSGVLTFAQAAKKYSEDPGSAVNGGDLGYAPLQVYDPGFARGVEALKIGQISAPVKSSFGWHLIKLNDVKVDTDSMDAYKEKANEIIFEREFTEAVIAWERELREMAYIHVLDPVLLNAGVNIDQAPVQENKPFTQADDHDSQEKSKDSVYID